MGRKKQTIVASGGIIGDSMDKTVAFMMGRVNHLPSQDLPLLYENNESNQMNGKLQTKQSDFKSKLTFKGNMPSNYQAMLRNNKLFLEEENYEKNQKESAVSSFNYEGTISDIDIEGFDSDIEFDESMKEEGFKESFEMLNENFDLDAENELSISLIENQLEIETSALSSIEKINPENDDELKFCEELKLEDLNSSSTKFNPILTPFTSLDVITPNFESEHLYSDDKELLKDLVDKLDDLELEEGEDLKESKTELDIKGLDIKYDFDFSKENSFENLLKKRRNPDNYSWNLLPITNYKKIKKKLFYSEIEFPSRDDHFYNLLIDRYRFNLSQT